MWKCTRRSICAPYQSIYKVDLTFGTLGLFAEIFEAETCAIAVDSRERVYVLTSRNKILIFKEEGTFIASIGKDATLSLQLRVQAHAHARIFAWLLGTCISETTSDIAGNQTPLSRKTMRQAVKNYTSKHSTRKNSLLLSSPCQVTCIYRN